MEKKGVKIPTKRVFILAESIDYQDGAIVSKTIIDHETGTVTLFAFDKGQGLSEHAVPFDALVYVLDGKVKFTIEGEDFELKAGEAIIMPANRPHAVDAVEKFKMLLTLIRA